MQRTPNPVACMWICAIALACSIPPAAAWGSGFALEESSIRGMGQAFAGSAAGTPEPSTVWFNPAGMTGLDASIQIGGALGVPSFDFRNQGSTQQTGVGPIPLAGGNRENGGELVGVPNLYLVYPITDRFSAGISFNAPFGLRSKYDRNWVGRYQAVESNITNLNLNPAIAWQINDEWSVGAGISMSYIDAKLTNAVDFAAICAQAAGGLCPNGAAPGQGAFDGYVNNTADDFGVGYNFGVLWRGAFWNGAQPTRVGLAYRSEIQHELRGRAKFYQPTTLGGFGALGPLGAGLAATFANTNVRSKATLPDSVTVSLDQRINERLSVAAELVWTNWSDIQQLSIQFTNALTPTTTETLNYRDTWRFAFGGEYTLNEQWSLRTGAAFDQSPVGRARDRTLRIPDADRWRLSFGASYQPIPEISIDLGYSHLFLPDAKSRRTGTTGDVVVGEFQSSADIVGLQLVYRMF